MNDEGVKVILIGNAAVGKTSIVNHFLGLPFDSEVLSTNMASYQRKMVKSSTGKDVRLDIWDTAGQEKYRSMLPIYFRAAAIALLCFDSESIDSISEWHSIVNRAAPQCHIILILTKKDLYSSEEFARINPLIHAKANELKIPNVFVTSAKNGTGINELFEKAATLATQVETPITTTSVLSDEKTQNKSQSCC